MTDDSIFIVEEDGKLRFKEMTEKGLDPSPKIIKGNGFNLIRFPSGLEDICIPDGDILVQKIEKKHKPQTEAEASFFVFVELQSYSTRFHDRLKE